MDKNEANITCYLPSGGYLLTLDLGRSIPMDQLDLNEYLASVYINDFYLDDIVLALGSEDGPYEFEIPKEYIQCGHNIVSINCEELWSPSDYGSEDSRSMGLCVESVIFTPMN